MSEITDEQDRLKTSKLILDGETSGEAGHGGEMRSYVKELLADTAGSGVPAGTKDNAKEAETAKPAAMAEPIRPQAEGVLSGADEKVAEDPRLIAFEGQYKKLPGDVQARVPWKTIARRLLADDSEKLKLARAMQGGGELVGVDAEGKALFKDKGVEPVMYGFDKESKLMQIYNRDPEQMAKVDKWADYFETRGQVLKDGYELFPYNNSDHGFSDEMNQVQSHTKGPFVAGKDMSEWRASWLESGDRPTLARIACFFDVVRRVCVDINDPGERLDRYGAVRLLRA